MSKTAEIKRLDEIIEGASKLPNKIKVLTIHKNGSIMYLLKIKNIF